MIEVVIAMVVIAIAVGTLLAVLAEMTNATVMPEVVNIATHLAERELDRVSGLRFSAVANEGPTSYTGAFSNYSYQVTVSAVPAAIAVDPGMTQYKQVQVTVTPTTAGAVSLTTLLTRKVT